MLHVKIIVSFGTSGRGNSMLSPTVEPPLTVISLQWPLFGGQSIHRLSFKPLYNGHVLLSPRWPLRRDSTFSKEHISQGRISWAI